MYPGGVTVRHGFGTDRGRRAVPDAGVGSDVTLWGRASGGSVLPIDAVAQAGGTVGYELMCAVTTRVPIRAD